MLIKFDFSSKTGILVVKFAFATANLKIETLRMRRRFARVFGEYRRSELRGLDVTISARYHWSVARQLTPFPLRHRNLRNLTLQECYLTNTRAFFRLRTAL